MNTRQQDNLKKCMSALAVIAILVVIMALTGCTTIHWQGADGTSLDAYSFLSNKTLAGSLKDDGKKRTLIVKELDENQTDGISQIVGAAVEAAVKGIKP